MGDTTLGSGAVDDADNVSRERAHLMAAPPLPPKPPEPEESLPPNVLQFPVSKKMAILHALDEIQSGLEATGIRIDETGERLKHLRESIRASRERVSRYASACKPQAAAAPQDAPVSPNA